MVDSNRISLLDDQGSNFDYILRQRSHYLEALRVIVIVTRDASEYICLSLIWLFRRLRGVEGIEFHACIKDTQDCRIE